MNRFSNPLRHLAVLALPAALVLPASGQTCPPGPVVCTPGSLLLFPEYDDTSTVGEGGAGRLYLLTVTNTATAGPDVELEFVYIDARDYDDDGRGDCLEFNRTETLTPRDTLSVITAYHNPKHGLGYVYVFAKRLGAAIRHNHLIGDEIVMDAFADFSYSHKAFVFRASQSIPDGGGTDLDLDGLRDLDGSEYQQAPDRLLIPRFMGQVVPGAPESDLILIALSGGPYFTTNVNFKVYNDNEVPHTFTYSFSCWQKLPLIALNGVFDNAFLQTTDDAANEILGAATFQEAGWFSLEGLNASSTADLILDAAILAVLVERVGSQSAADLPFAVGSRDTGALLSHSIFSDV